MDHLKILDKDFEGKDVASAEDRPKGTAQEIKALFDAPTKRVVQPKHNALVDALRASRGAGLVGAETFAGVSGGTVQEQMQQVQGNLEAFAQPTDAALLALRQNLTALSDEGGAASIGIAPFKGMNETQVQGALMRLRADIDSLIEGLLPDFSVQTKQLAEGAVTTEKLAAEAVTLRALATEVRQAIHALLAMRGAETASEMEDFTAETGCFINAAAGWNTFRFRRVFDRVPAVFVTAENFAGRVQLQSITREGFLYCLFVTTAEVQTEQTTGRGILLHYIAAEYGGDEGC